MNFLKRLSGIFAAPARRSGASSYSFAVQCNRCGEVIRSRVNWGADLSPDYDERGNVTTYFCRKVLVGTQRCYQPIEVTLTFDSRHQLSDKQITGGKFVDI